MLQRATELGQILFTQDDDFLGIAAQWQRDERFFSGIVYAHQLGPGIGQIIEDLELIAECGDQFALHNRVVYLPLS